MKTESPGLPVLGELNRRRELMTNFKLGTDWIRMAEIFRSIDSETIALALERFPSEDVWAWGLVTWEEFTEFSKHLRAELEAGKQ